MTEKQSDKCGVFGLLGSRPSDYRMVESTVLCAARLVMGSNPYQCLWIHDLQAGWSAAMLAAWRSAGVTSEVNLKNPLQARKGSTLTLKPRVDLTRSPKQGYHWPHKKILCPPIFLLIKDLLTTGRYVYHPLLPLSVNKDDPAVYADFTVLERSPSAMAVHHGMLR